jgi:TRAP-type C4-dicarboxylate transport system substrate-binding protein
VRFVCATLIALACGTLARPAVAEPESEHEHVIRLSSIAPEGTGYARQLRAFASETLAETDGRVRIKLYFNAVAGDEYQAWQRVERGQLDAVASAAMLCERLAPSMRVMRLPGMFRNRDEAMSVLGRMKPLTDREFEHAGARNLGELMIGPVILFSRDPMRSLGEIRKHTMWIWDADQVMTPIYGALGFNVLPLSINDAGPAFEQHRHDGFTATPAAALAFQWTTLARYYEPITVAYLVGCMVVANRAFDELSLKDQQAVQGAAAKALAHMNEVGLEMDTQLLGGLFEKQGLRRVPISSTMQVEYEVSSARARAALMAAHRVDPELVGKVEQMLNEIRGRHGSRR